MLSEADIKPASLTHQKTKTKTN